MKPARTALAVLAASCLIAGCAVGPDFQRPKLDPAAGYGRAAAAPGLSAGSDIPAQWWTRFHARALDRLIADALARNSDLKAAQAGLQVAMENLAAQRGAFFPSVGGSATASRNQGASEPAPFLASNLLLYNLYQGQLSASWTIDIWGANRRNVEALQAQAESQRFQLESARLALAANLVAAAVQEASLRAQIAATQDMIRAGRETLAIFRRQLDLGQIAGADFAAQDTAVAQLEQSLPPLSRQLAQEKDLLTALAGRFPSEEIAPAFVLSDFQLPADLPLSLPSRVIEQRPDIRVAEANLHSACALVGVAVANQLPNLVLTADVGAIATTARNLFVPGNELWAVGGGVTQPIFQGGSLVHRTRAARAAYEQAADQYRSVVIAAFQNVADALQALQADAALLKAAARSERAAADSLTITRRELDLGGVSYLGVLAAEQAYQQARIALIQAQAGRLADAAALFQALGGGWWNRGAP
ncbi:MAG TPA: efflux transporter outer membrane subunit [Opitutaceae bacterium]|jgi:NodT family efflux transporter outer membrane factor (OMF) lipoprotein|nr:efflux transporter outer membrane subunit [Opitutaceae bacterium]